MSTPIPAHESTHVSEANLDKAQRRFRKGMDRRIKQINRDIKRASKRGSSKIEYAERISDGGFIRDNKVLREFEDAGYQIDTWGSIRFYNFTISW